VPFQVPTNGSLPDVPPVELVVVVVVVLAVVLVEVVVVVVVCVPLVPVEVPLLVLVFELVVFVPELVVVLLLAPLPEQPDATTSSNPIPRAQPRERLIRIIRTLRHLAFKWIRPGGLLT
jgi:hypothetical protein